MEYITHTDQLAQICDQLSQAKWLVVDTEFMRYNTYYPQLSLIQLATPDQQLYLLDPIETQDLSCFWEVLHNPAITKIMHSARQDLELFLNESGKLPQNVYDTQISSVFFGYGEGASLAKLVEGETGIQLPKDQTKTDWNQRPLTEQQLEYALNDVRYLGNIYLKQQKELTLEQKTALEWDFNEQLNPSLYEIKPEKAYKKLKGYSQLKPNQKPKAKALAAWREKLAQDLNKPRRWILGDDPILTLAKRTINEFFQLENLIPPATLRKHGKEILSLLTPPYPDEPEISYTKIKSTPELEKLKKLAAEIAQKNNLLHPPAQKHLADLLNNKGILLNGWRSVIFQDLLKNINLPT